MHSQHANATSLTAFCIVRNMVGMYNLGLNTRLEGPPAALRVPNSTYAHTGMPRNVAAFCHASHKAYIYAKGYLEDASVYTGAAFLWETTHLEQMRP